MTAGTLISSSLRLLGVLASGEAAQASEATDGLASLNDLLDSWSNENLMIPNKVREVFALIPGQQTYTMGTGGNLNTQRPMRIEQALIQITSVTPMLELPLNILTEEQYAQVRIKALSSTYPQSLYPEGTYPLENLNLWPIPNQGNNLVLYSWKPLANLAMLTTPISLPPGYARALRYNLAIELAPEYGREPSPSIVEIALTARANLKRMNSKPQYLEVDSALRARSSVWNWYTGESS